MRAGQTLERGDNTLRVLQQRLKDAVAQARRDDPAARTMQDQRWVSALKGASAYEAYRKRVHSGLHPTLIAEFLLLDEYFPRSVRYSAENLHDALVQIDRHHPGAHPEILKLSRWLVARLQYATVEHIIEDEYPSIELSLIHI